MTPLKKTHAFKFIICKTGSNWNTSQVGNGGVKVSEGPNHISPPFWILSFHAASRTCMTVLACAILSLTIQLKATCKTLGKSKASLNLQFLCIKYCPWQFFVPFLGWLSDLLERLSDLQIGDKNVTLNHLVFLVRRRELPELNAWGSFRHSNEFFFRWNVIIFLRWGYQKMMLQPKVAIRFFICLDWGSHKP